MADTVWTIGHSTRPLEEFLELLTANRIEAVADVRQAAKGEDAARIRQATDRLGEVSMRIGEALGRAGAPPGAGGEQGGGEGVVDAEFEEIDKKDRRTGS